MNLEDTLNTWMDEHEAEILDLLDAEMERFRENHPGLDDSIAQNNALMMANRRFMARTLGAVLPDWLAARGFTAETQSPQRG